MRGGPAGVAPRREGRRPPGRLLMCGTLCAAHCFTFLFPPLGPATPGGGGGGLPGVSRRAPDGRWDGWAKRPASIAGRRPLVTPRGAREPLGVACGTNQVTKRPSRPRPTACRPTKTPRRQKRGDCKKFKFAPRRPLRRMMDIPP